MSELYSAPSVPRPTISNVATVAWTNANTVFQRLLQQLDAEVRKNIILRCDELPLLQGTEDELEYIFSGLLQMILEKKSSVNRLFLHITCSAAPLSTSGWKQYSILFNTNINPCPDWMQAHGQRTTEIATLLQKNNGSLEMTEAQGCIFTLSLPGKPI